MKSVFALALLVLSNSFLAAQEIPKNLWGKWKITRELPATTISCWDESQARKLIGTEIEYTKDSFRWEKVTQKNLTVKLRTVDARTFMFENAGGGTPRNYVDFEQLGIRTKTVTAMTLEYDGTPAFQEVYETPGNDVLIKSKNAIVLSVCNVFFEARRIQAKRTSAKIK